MRNAAGKPRDPYLLGSLHKGLQVIDCFARQSSWSLAELAATLRQSKPTLFRILHTLEEFGYVRKDTRTTRYSLDLRFHTLGTAAVRHEQLRWQSLLPLQELAQHSGETVHVGILREDAALCVQAIDSVHVVRTHAFVGKRIPLHASALGKVLLAYLPNERLDGLLATPSLPRFTARTITDPAALRAVLTQVKEQGWAADDEENEWGTRCIAAPVFDRDARACAAVAVSAPATRLDLAQAEPMVQHVIAAGHRISTLLANPQHDPATARVA